MPIKAEIVASALLYEAKQMGINDVSNMKLQKLLHDTQGYHLALFDERAFSENLEAWKHGSVVPSIYHHYKHYGKDSIPAPPLPEIPQAIRTAILYALTGRGGKSAVELSKENHTETPWKEAWPVTLWHKITNRWVAAIINETTMKAFYIQKIMDRQNAISPTVDEHCFSVDLPTFREIETILAAPASCALKNFMKTPSVFENGQINEILKARQQARA